MTYNVIICSMSGKETYRDNSHDPNLLGSTFFCAGYKAEEQFYHPEGKGATVGAEVAYTTRSDSMAIIEDRSLTKLKGCVYYRGGLCRNGGGYCPVAGVVSIEDYGKRVIDVRKLLITKYATG